MKIVILPRALKHGFEEDQIRRALKDPRKKRVSIPARNKKGVAYSRDGREAYLAQDVPNGPMLHILVSHRKGTIFRQAELVVFHCREMSQQEKGVYKRR